MGVRPHSAGGRTLIPTPRAAGGVPRHRCRDVSAGMLRGEPFQGVAQVRLRRHQPPHQQCDAEPDQGTGGDGELELVAVIMAIPPWRPDGGVSVVN